MKVLLRASQSRADGKWQLLTSAWISLIKYMFLPWLQTRVEKYNETYVLG